MTMLGKWVAYLDDGSIGYGQVHCEGETFACVVDADGVPMSLSVDTFVCAYDTKEEAARADEILNSDDLFDAIDAAPEVVAAKDAVNSLTEAMVGAHAALDRARDEAEKRLLAEFMARPVGAEDAA